MAYGTGKYEYQLVDGWPKLPKGWSLVDASLSIDSRDRVYALDRGAHPVLVFNPEGDLLTSWGEGSFKSAHGICVGSDGSVYCTDAGKQTVSKFTYEGKLLLVLSNKDRSSDTGYTHELGMGKQDSVATIIRGGTPFNEPTGIALSSSGDIYVSDGYGNSRIHKFAPDGTLLLSWGEPGDAAGQFRVPHCICADKQGHVWVADRENSRIQIFSSQGKFLSQWTDLSRPNTVFIDNQEAVYIGGGKPNWRVNIFDINGKLLASLHGQEEDKMSPLFLSAHAVVVDSVGDLYIAGVAVSSTGNSPRPAYVRKFARKH